MATADTLALVGLLATVLFGLVAFLQTRRANRLAGAIARAERATESPDVSFGWAFGDRGLLYIFATPIRVGRTVQVPISYAIENNGGRSAKEIEIHIRIPTALCLPDTPGVTVGFQSESRRVHTQVTSIQEGHRTFTFSVTALDPGQRISIQHALFLSEETIIEREVSATTKDQRDVVLTVRAALSYVVQVIVTWEDHRPWTGVYDLMVINTDQRSVAAALATFNHELMDSHNKMLAGLRWWRRLTYRGESTELRVVIVDAAKLTPGSAAPIDQASDEFTVAEGIRFPYGYFVPALGVQLEHK